MTVTIACVWVRGNVAYTAEYVDRLACMARRFTAHEAEVVCFTDQPWAVPGHVRSKAIAPLMNCAGWWSKLHLFNPYNGLTGRVVYFDLDTLVVDSIDPIIEWPAQFATIPDGGSSFKPKDGKTVIKRFNSSVMAFDAGMYPDLWTAYNSAVSQRLWGDQDFLAERHSDAATMPAGWFPRLSTIGASGLIPDGARVVLSKKPKNVEAAKLWPWFNARWRAA